MGNECQDIVEESTPSDIFRNVDSTDRIEEKREKLYTWMIWHFVRYLLVISSLKEEAAGAIEEKSLGEQSQGKTRPLTDSTCILMGGKK
jgi:hypothetical protein